MSQSMGSLHINQKAAVGLMAVSVAALYCIYLYVAKPPIPDSAADLYSGKDGTWKASPFVDIPQTILEERSSINIEERSINVETGGKKFLIHARIINAKKQNGISVLLLHGAAFSSANWEKINTLQLIGAMGLRGMAIDLPEHNKDKIEDSDKAGFLESLIGQENLNKPIIISPSMSGSFAVPYIMGGKPQECHKKVFAFIPIAPVGTSRYKHSEYHRCAVPTMIVYGTKDKSLGLEATGNLRNMPNKEIFPMEKAGHACYIDKPQEWNRLLYNFLLSMEKYRNHKYENY